MSAETLTQAKAPLWGELLYHLGEIYRDTGSQEDVIQRLKEAGFTGNEKDCDDHPLAKYLRAKIPGRSIYIGLNFVSMEYGNDTMSFTLPRPHEWQDFAKPAEKQRAVRNRLADLLWFGLDEIGIKYDKDADDLPGCPVVAIRSKRIAIFTRRCHAYQHSCTGGDESLHTGIVRELRIKGWQVFTLWECQLRGGTAHLEVLLSALKGT